MAERVAGSRTLTFSPRDRWTMFAAVLAWGAFGGISSYAYAAIRGDDLRLGLASGVPAYMLIGSVAAMVGVYILARTAHYTTSERIHCLAFAALCGLFWAPILEAGRDFVEKRVVEERVADARASIADLERLASNLEGVRSDTLQAQIDETTSSVLDLLTSEQRLQARIKADSTSTVVAALESLNQVAEARPDVAVSAISTIESSLREGPPFFGRPVVPEVAAPPP